MNAQLITINGINLGTKFWWYYLLLKLYHIILGLIIVNDGCGSNFTVVHYLRYKKGVLISAHQNDLNNEVDNLSGMACNHSVVCNYLFIIISHNQVGTFYHPCRMKAGKKTGI